MPPRYFDNCLHNLRIMVTRPRPQGEILCQHIRAAGGHAIYFPTIEIVPVTQQISELDQFDWLIFMSPHAVYHSANMILAHGPNKIKIAAVGQGTAKALQEANLSVDIYPADDWRSEGLLDLPEFQALAHKKIAIVCGENGRELLSDTLITRGAKVTSLVFYRRVVPEIDVSEYAQLLHERKIDVIVCTSNDSVKNLKLLLGQAAGHYLLEVPLLVISDRIKIYAKELGFEKIILANNAGHDVIIEILASLKG